MTKVNRLLPEWTPLDAVILAWPHTQTDWAPWLDSVVETYLSLINEINNSGTGVILLCRKQDCEDVSAQLSSTNKVLLLPAEYNDTWVRDYAFLTCRQGQHNIPVEYNFNGWGNKFDATLDNQVNERYLAPLCQQPLTSYPLVCEGGALEIDQQGHLLSTALCLTNPERNGQLSLQQYTERFQLQLGANAVSILEHGHLEGDDTDGHIDTLVRFTPTNGLVIQACSNRPADAHFEGLTALVNECQQRIATHSIFELPLPYVENQEGDRLPASYANFLICNDSILAPIYQQPEDQEALRVLQQAYPSYTIVAINCLPLVQQYGSLHCITMQVPVETLLPDITHKIFQGVSIYD